MATIGKQSAIELSLIRVIFGMPMTVTTGYSAVDFRDGCRCASVDFTEALLALIEPVEGVELDIRTDAEYSERMRDNEDRLERTWGED